MKLQNFAVSDKIYWYSHSLLNMNKLEYGIYYIQWKSLQITLPELSRYASKFQFKSDFNFEVVGARWVLGSAIVQWFVCRLRAEPDSPVLAIW